MAHISSYPSVYAIGDRALTELFSSPVVVEEKIDGSQFSIQRLAGQGLLCRSKGADIDIAAPQKMFTKAVETAAALDLVDGWVYRCEYLHSPRHNVLAYSRAPKQHLIIFDIMVGLEAYLNPAQKAAEAARIGLECVPVLLEGQIGPGDFDRLKQLLDRESVLGGCKIEGFAVKNYNVFTVDKKIAVGKFVSESFKELHRKEWQKGPAPIGVVDRLISELRAPPRWQKAVQHLREAGTMTDSPRDIGAIIKEVQADIEKEVADYIKDELYRCHRAVILRGAIGGVAEWYKERLAESAFAPKSEPIAA